jgi:hypothetical protein
LYFITIVLQLFLYICFPRHHDARARTFYSNDFSHLGPGGSLAHEAVTLTFLIVDRKGAFALLAGYHQETLCMDIADNVV